MLVKLYADDTVDDEYQPTVVYTCIENLRTVMNERHGLSRSNDSENRGICLPRCVAGGVLDLHPGEDRTSAVVGRDSKGVSRESVQSAARVVEELESLVACVDEGRDHFEVLDIVYSVWAGDLE